MLYLRFVHSQFHVDGSGFIGIGEVKGFIYGADTHVTGDS